jgi:hypothetical protein
MSDMTTDYLNDLKCCGNCENGHLADEGMGCYLKIKDSCDWPNISPHHFCDNWQYDSMNRHHRIHI